MAKLRAGVQKQIDEAKATGLVTDGCSCVPDFDVKECCELHDLLYARVWGTRAQADKIFRQCIQRQGGRKHWLLGWLYWIGVRVAYWPWIAVRGVNSKWKFNHVNRGRKLQLMEIQHRQSGP